MSVVDPPARIVQSKFGEFAQSVHVSFPVARERSDVSPVAFVEVSEQSASVTEHCRDDVLSEVVFRIRIRFILFKILDQGICREDVYSHRCLRALRMLRLLSELRYPSILIGRHYSESGRFLERDVYDGYRAVRLVRNMLFEHYRIIHLVDVVAGQYQHVLRVVLLDELYILIDSVRCSLEPVSALLRLIRRQYVQAPEPQIEVPRAARAKIVVQLKRLILSQDSDRIYAGIDTVGQRKIDDPVPCTKRNCRFRDIVGQRSQSASLTACEEHRYTFFCTEHFASPISNIIAEYFGIETLIYLSRPLRWPFLLLYIFPVLGEARSVSMTHL